MYNFNPGLTNFGSRLLIAVIALVLGFSVTVPAQTSVDPTFSPELTKTATPTGAAVYAVQSDGKVIFVDNETVGSTSSGFIQRLNSDGTPDIRFGCDVCTGLYLTSVAITADGKIVVGGFTTDGISLLFAKMYRFNSDGTRDSTFSFTSVNGSASRIAPMADGRMVVYFTNSFQGVTSNFVRRVNADGSFDTTFSTIALSGGRSSYQIVTELRVMTDGRVVLGGTIAGFSPLATLNRYTAAGTVDSTFEIPAFSDSRNSSTSIGGVAMLPDGGLFVTGDFSSVNGVSRVGIVKLLPAGNVDSGFSGQLDGSETGGHAELLTDGKLLTSVGTPFASPEFRRFNSDGSRDLSFSAPDSVGHYSNWIVDTTGRALFGKTTGFFRLTASGATDTTFNSGLRVSGAASAVASAPDGGVFVTGNFSFANSTPLARAARLTTLGATDPTFQPGTGFNGDPTRVVRQSDGKYLIAGNFTAYNGTQMIGFGRLNTDGSLDTSFNTPVNGEVSTIVLRPDGKIYIGGMFSTINGTNRPLIALLNQDGTVDQSFTPQITESQISAIVPLPDGKVLIGGRFTGIEGFNRQHLARLNANGSLDQTFNAGSMVEVLTLAVQPDGKIVVGGGLAISRRNADGSFDPTFTPVNFQGTLNAMILQSNGAIVFGGSITNIGGQTRNNLARLGSNGAIDTLFLPLGVNGAVDGLTEQADGRIVAVGRFTAVDGFARKGIARFTTGPVRRPTKFDFDGDGRADFTVFRPSTNKWFVLQTSDFNYTETTFAIAGDVPVPADYDGDGKTDHAIYRNGAWWYRSSINGAQINVNWGSAGDIPRPGDFDGDGKIDFIVYRPSNGVWYRMTSFGAQTQIGFGAAGDQPVTGDFDGDGKVDPAIFRPSTGDWWYAASSANGAHRPVHWGATGDVPVPADYDGDGKTDFAIFRPTEGGWFVSSSVDGSFRSLSFGQQGDRPISADYDGDGKADIAVFRPSTGVWYLLQSTAGFGAPQWGISSDLPIPAAFLP